jgi:hypothetical protein
VIPILAARRAARRSVLLASWPGGGHATAGAEPPRALCGAGGRGVLRGRHRLSRRRHRANRDAAPTSCKALLI